MRYQGVSSDILHHHPSNWKKPVLKICHKKIDNIENRGRHLNRGVLEGKETESSMTGIRFKVGLPSTSNPNNNNMNKEQELENRNGNVIPGALDETFTEGNEPLRKTKGDSNGFVRWYQKKRPRGHRPESRNSTEDSTLQAQKNVPIELQTAKPEKQNVFAQAQVTVHSRSATLRPSTPLRDPTSGSVKRYSEDLNTTHFINGSSNQRVDRHSPSLEKYEKAAAAAACSPPNGSGAAPAADGVAYNSTPSENGAYVPAEKVNMDLFEWPRILVALSRKEKEDDFLVMKGTKLPQRPKRRPKHVERVLQNCFPGNWLSDLTRGRYEVREKKCVKKKPRGLKAMESSESCSE